MDADQLAGSRRSTVGWGLGQTSAHHQAMSGIEVMLSPTALLRTGQWGISNSPNAFLSKYTFGPSVEGLFLQSNLGVVTKLSIWMTAQPPAYMSCSFRMPEFDDLAVMVDELGKLRRDGIVPNCIWFMGLIENLCMLGRREDFWEGDGPIRRLPHVGAAEGLRGLPMAGAVGALRPKANHPGPVRRNQRDTSARAPTGTLEGSLFVGDEGRGVDATTIPLEHGMMWAGVPNLLSLSSSTGPSRASESAEPGMAITRPSSRTRARRCSSGCVVCRPIHEAHGLEPMVDFFMHERHVVVMNMFSYDQNDPAAQERVRGLYNGLFDEGQEEGLRHVSQPRTSYG